MAMLQVQIGVSTLFTLGLLVLLSAVCREPLTVAAFPSMQEQKPAPDPQIGILVHPPLQMIVTPNSPIYLPCVANYSEQDDGSKGNDYYDENDDDDVDNNDMDTEDNDETQANSKNDISKIDKMKNTHFADLKPVNVAIIREPSASNKNDADDDDSSEGFSVFKRDVGSDSNKRMVNHIWYRNGKQITGTKGKYFQILANGTLKINYSPFATGVFRCMANATTPGIGSVLSKACNVQQAILERQASATNYTVEHGSSIVIDCPFKSIPKMNVSWSFENNTDIQFDSSERHFQLLNGSLLITNIQQEDKQKYRCTATNIYLSKPKQVYSLLHVDTTSANTDFKLLPSLQSETIMVPSGETLRLLCAPTFTIKSDKNVIQWTFTPRTSSEATSTVANAIHLETRKANELTIVETTVENHDGIYTCSLGDDHQNFDVTITTPPMIQSGFLSKEEALGYYVSFNCSVSGNPKPTVKWYRNGELVHYDWIVNYNEPKLIIQTFEERHKGIYQCVATNVAGETHATGLLSLKRKNYMERPKNVKCYPMSYSKIKVTFETPQNYKWHAITYYTASKFEPKWLSNVLHNPQTRDEFVIPDAKRRPFEPFMLYFRGMEHIGSESVNKGGSRSVHVQFDMSRLSEGVKCAIQGLPIYPMFFPNGIFIWWPKVEHTNVTAYVVQFWNNDSSNPTVFSDQIVGTTKTIEEFQTFADIDGYLEKISAATNVYPRSSQTIDEQLIKQKKRRSTAEGSLTSPPNDVRMKQINSAKPQNGFNETITEVRVNGNVTGILIPNTKKIMVRVLVSVHDEDGELYQDMQYVEWKTIEDIPGRTSKFAVDSVEAHRVTFVATDRNIDCIKICYRAHEIVCDVRPIQSRYIEVDSLSAFTLYTFLIRECDGMKTLYGEFNIQTKHDVPGPVTNHKISQKDGGILVEWNAPINANGILNYYLVEWTVKNQTHSQRINYKNDTRKTVFRFPNISQDDRFNITIRAVSSFGVGIPIYVDLRNVINFPNNESLEPSSSRHDPRLGITIGIFLSIICLLICTWIIVRHRRCIKSRQQPDSNGAIVRNAFQERTISDRSGATATTLFPSPPASISLNCAVDVHEMQTLIGIPTMDSVTNSNGQNGLSKKRENGNGTGLIKNANNSDCDQSNNNRDMIGHSDNEDDDDDENEQNMSRRGLISSTPKNQHKPISVSNGTLRKSSTNETNTAYFTDDDDDNSIEHEIDNACGDISQLKLKSGNGSTTNILPNGSVIHSNTILPQDNLQQHSTAKVEQLPALASKKTNGNKMRKASIKSSSTPTNLDNSQQKLLLDTSVNSSFSSSCSSSPSTVENNSCSKRKHYNRNSLEHIERANSDHHKNHHHHSPNHIKHDHYQFHSSIENGINDAHRNHKSAGIESEKTDEDENKEVTTNNAIESIQHNETDADTTNVPSPPSAINLNDDKYFQKRFQKWDFRRPIVGPNG